MTTWHLPRGYENLIFPAASWSKYLGYYDSPIRGEGDQCGTSGLNVSFGSRIQGTTPSASLGRALNREFSFLLEAGVSN